MQNLFNQAYQNALNQSNYKYQSQAAYYAQQQQQAALNNTYYNIFHYNLFQINFANYTKMIKEVTIDADNKKSCSITFCYGLSRYREYDRDNRVSKKQ